MAQQEQIRTIKSVGTSCQIIDALVELNGAGITELADYLGVSKGSIHTHLATLRKHERVVKEGEQYQPSFRYLEIGERLRRQQDLIQIAKPELEKLAEQTGDRAHIVTEEHGKSVLLYVAAGPEALASSSYVGRRRHLHCTAAGKALLANLPKKRIESIIDKHGLPKYTGKTITDPYDLFDELETIREDGVSYNRGEKVKSLSAVAAPIMGNDDDVIASISITSPRSEKNGDSGTELTQMVQNTANVIEVNNQIRAQSVDR